MKNTKKALKKGFSLVEMLVVIAVIGIIAAIAVPNIGRINDSATDAKARRNAQNLASIFASAQAAGHDFSSAGTVTTVGGTGGLIDLITTGHTITDVDSPFYESFFGVKGMDVTAASDTNTGAAKYLTFDGDSNMLLYTGSQ